jgi:hypothetical protein
LKDFRVVVIIIYVLLGMQQRGCAAADSYQAAITQFFLHKGQQFRAFGPGKHIPDLAKPGRLARQAYG